MNKIYNEYKRLKLIDNSKLYLQDKLDKNKYLFSYNSFLAHAKHANSYNFFKKYKLNF